ncbi:MAG: helix-turn-helix transcriptional regulator [Oxalobacteraceae bacterium]|nr:helix-turn-helix transcriptional regulator [Oxalobacteraceae bacterium]
MIDNSEQHKDPFLIALGERVTALRSRHGLSRKALARRADVSERHLQNIELGSGNASIQFLRQLSQVLNCRLVEMIGDESISSVEWLKIREILRGRTEAELAQASAALIDTFEKPSSESARRQRVAFIGLRGAGKSTLGQMLADNWMVPFIELERQIEKVAGCSIPEIHALYGSAAYRRYECRALEEIIRRFPRAVIATPGGIVSDPGTFDSLLSHCYTVWLQAAPEEYMERGLSQFDSRLRADNREAMADLKNLIEIRAPFYSQADEIFDTSDITQEAAFMNLVDQLRGTVLSQDKAFS